MSLLYQRRRLKVNKIRRQINANRVLLQRLLSLIALSMCIGICYLSYLSLKMPQWYINTQKLIKADGSILKIQGNIITPDYKIINIIRQTQLPYTQIFRLNTKELEDNILQLKTVKKVYIRRYWFPARFIISIEERTPIFLLAPNLETEPTSAITADGILLDREYFPFKTPIKAKKLLTYGVKDGQDEVWDKKKVENILKVVKTIEGYSNQEVKYIDYRNKNDVYIMLQEYLIRVGEINDTVISRVKCIATILPEVKKIDKKIKYIDLRWEVSHYFRLEDSKDIESKTKQPSEIKPIPPKQTAKEEQPNQSENHPSDIQEQKSQQNEELD